MRYTHSKRPRIISMENQDSNQKVPALADRFEKGADAVQIADAMVAIWREISTALCPIIGQRGVAALYKRSVRLASRDHLWLNHVSEGTPATLDITTLKSVLAEQSAVAAAAGGDAVLNTFYELLAVLIGDSLTQRLLCSVWGNSSDSSTFKQDHPS